MSTLHYVKASDVDRDFCFLEVSRKQNESPFMDVRISDDRQLSFHIYRSQSDISVSPEEWIEIHEKALSFYKSELENQDTFESWGK
ncbi:hypothetical protein [Vibrio neptunius]|uniref:hypothetical protein n=1 Tax=Vibrio neptunius TaxID=170651 RepID=UPI0019D04CEF|nr:hypothetical protein [Vibrio neptunius]MBN3574316.1 hypothetical protein [Vibrio neptunius]QXX08932.1 hypothetical protein KW548_17630 [Vibrio neptunius]